MGTHVEEHGPSQSIHHNDVDHGQFGVTEHVRDEYEIRSFMGYGFKHESPTVVST